MIDQVAWERNNFFQFFFTGSGHSVYAGSQEICITSTRGVWPKPRQNARTPYPNTPGSRAQGFGVPCRRRQSLFCTGAGIRGSYVAVAVRAAFSVSARWADGLTQSGFPGVVALACAATDFADIASARQRLSRGLSHCRVQLVFVLVDHCSASHRGFPGRAQPSVASQHLVFMWQPQCLQTPSR